ncbi:MAG: hypothetical protein MSS49_01905 [Subdoligranulum variabile]|nr:hypothetical protein [Subdoligranulum variabile]
MELSIIAMVGTSFLLTVVPAFLKESLAKNFLLDCTQGCGDGKLARGVEDAAPLRIILKLAINK